MSTIKITEDFSPGDSFKIKISHNPTKDLTGGSLIFILRKREADTTNILKVTHTMGNDVLDLPATGLGYISVSATDTAGIPPGKYFGSIKRVIGTDVHTVIRSDIDNVDLVEVFPNLNN